MPHAVHIAIQYGEFQCGELQGVDKFVVFAVICLLLFKAVDRIHRQRLVIRKIYVFDCAASVGAVAQAADESVYFTIAGNFDGDLFAAVDVREELCKTKPPEKANSEGLLQSDNNSEEIAGKK